MASNRHLGRIIALQTLFEQDFRQALDDPHFDVAAVLERNITRYEATVEDKAFIRRLVQSVSEHQSELDEALQRLAPGWPLSTIARIDRVVLRMGLDELLRGKDVPTKVAINEAVELAKSFGNENSSKFINGVLGSAVRNSQDDAEQSPPNVNHDSPADADDHKKEVS